MPFFTDFDVWQRLLLAKIIRQRLICPWRRPPRRRCGGGCGGGFGSRARLGGCGQNIGRFRRFGHLGRLERSGSVFSSIWSFWNVFGRFSRIQTFGKDYLWHTPLSNALVIPHMCSNMFSKISETLWTQGFQNRLLSQTWLTVHLS